MQNSQMTYQKALNEAIKDLSDIDQEIFSLFAKFAGLTAKKVNNKLEFNRQFDLLYEFVLTINQVNIERQEELLQETGHNILNKITWLQNHEWDAYRIFWRWVDHNKQFV